MNISNYFGPSWLGAEFVRGRDVQLPSGPMVLLPVSSTHIGAAPVIASDVLKT